MATNEQVLNALKNALIQNGIKPQTMPGGTNQQGQYNPTPTPDPNTHQFTPGFKTPSGGVAAEE